MRGLCRLRRPYRGSTGVDLSVKFALVMYWFCAITGNCRGVTGPGEVMGSKDRSVGQRYDHCVRRTIFVQPKLDNAEIGVRLSEFDPF